MSNDSHLLIALIGPRLRLVHLTPSWGKEMPQTGLQLTQSIASV